MHQISTKIFFK